MSLLNKIRIKKSPKRENTFNMILGLIILIICLSYLFLFPINFIERSFYSYSKDRIPVLIFTLFGWLMFSFSLINHFKLSNNKFFFEQIEKISLFGIKNLINKAFLLLSILFLIIIISMFLIINPIKRERNAKDNFEKSKNELYKEIEKLNKLKNN